jgi:hypothetical protein
MKKLLILALMTITSYGATAQPPYRPLPNQFRDYVDFRKQQEKPKVEHKDGKVIITMSEEQFKRMQQIRMNQQRGFHPVVMRQQVCSRCEHKHKRHFRRRR